MKKLIFVHFYKIGLDVKRKKMTEMRSPPMTLSKILFYAFPEAAPIFQFDEGMAEKQLTLKITACSVAVTD